MLSNVSYATRIVASYLLLLGLLGTVAISQYRVITSLEGSNAYVDTAVERVTALSRLSDKVLRTDIHVMHFLADTNSSTASEIREEIAKTMEDVKNFAERALFSDGDLVVLINEYLAQADQSIRVIQQRHEHVHDLQNLAIEARREIGRLAQLIEQKSDAASTLAAVRASASSIRATMSRAS